ncbi:MAG: hypothetical protein AB7N65_19370 [Vicinamibacterales bacterium]
MLVRSETELTTAVTDALLGLLCATLALGLAGLPVHAGWKRHVWVVALGCMAAASLLGAIAHGVALSTATRAIIWKPLYLSLGLAVALVVVGAVYDWAGADAARRFLPWAIGAAVIFFALSQALGGAFVLFIAYEAIATLAALVIYTGLAVRGTQPGAGWVAAGVALSLVAAMVQVSGLSARMVVRFDHNGLFHLIQMVAVAVMAAGLRAGFRAG